MRQIVKRITFLIIFIGISYLFFGAANYLLSQKKEIKVSLFYQMIDRGNIEKLDIYDTGKIAGKFKTAPEGGQIIFELNLPPIPFPNYETLYNRVESKNPEASIQYISSGTGFMAILFSWAPILILIGFWIFFMRQMRGGGNNILSFGKSKAKLSSNQKKVTFDDVAGVDEAKGELQEIIEFLKEPQKFQKLGGRIPKGVLLMGPPGTGKTLLARAVAGEADVPFFSISGSDFVEMFVGVGASRVRDLFEQGKNNAPCIIFIDEIDAVGRQRGAGLGGGHDEREQTLNQLLVEMDGFESSEGIILVASTNRPDVLDPALLRPGRFDRRVVLNNPDVKGREGILSVHVKKIPLNSDVKMDTIARGTPGFSGADLANLVNEAALNAARYNQKDVRMYDFEFAKDKILMGSERKSMIISPKEKNITAVHEAGHAIVASTVPEADPVHKVTIIPRGLSMGSTWQLPETDQHNYSKTYLKSQLAILMAGRCAEELAFKEYSTGASNDIEKATDISREMVCSWGMSKKLGPLKFGTNNDNPFLGKQLGESGSNYSPATAREIEKEMKELVTEAQATATRILNHKKSALQAIAQVLIEKETITGEEVKKMLQEP